MERVVVEDVTTEALAVVLAGTPRGIATHRDELSGWVRSMDQYKQGGRGADRQFWLSAWSNSYVSVDRRNRTEPLIIQRPFVSVYGSIQPRVLYEVGSHREDGLLDRFLFSYPEPVPSEWSEDEISDEARERYALLYARLRTRSMPTDDYGDPMPMKIGFSEAAKALLKAEINEHRTEMHAAGFPSRLKGSWAKLEAYLARFCLIVAMARVVDTEAAERIAEGDVLAASMLVAYFKSMAKRVYGELYGEDPDEQLVADVSAFLEMQGRSWEGQPAELHKAFTSRYKPPTPEALTRKLKAAAKKYPSFSFKSEERWVRELRNKRRFVVLSLKNSGIGGNDREGV